MKCFGYSKQNDELLQEFSEITIQARPNVLRKMADFLINCADEIEQHPDWEHEHFQDFFDVDEASFDLIVYRDDS